MLDQAREFLARVVPWPQDGGTEWINVHWTFVPRNAKPGQKLPWTGRAVKNTTDAYNALQFALKSKDTRDIYFCLSSQAEARETRSARNFTYFRPLRTAAGAVKLKALWMDIDAKGGEDSYASKEEAAAALGNFLKVSGLPKPSMVVSSGGGLHVYWVLASAITPDEWYPLAMALREAGVRHGLKFDKEVTTDAARVLRVPETFNHKTTPPRPVRVAGSPTDFDYSVEKIAQALASYKVDVSLPQHFTGNGMIPPGFPRRPPLPGVSDLSAGIETTMPQAEIRACLDAIPNTKEDWNFWNTIGMRVFAACDGADYGLVEWERWSSKLSTKGTDTVRERWDILQTSPPTRTGAGALVTAARDALKDPSWSPRSHAQVQTAQTTQPGQAQVLVPTPGLLPPRVTITQTDLPPDYKRDQQGVIWLLSQDDDGNIIQNRVSDYPMTDGMIQTVPEEILLFDTRIGPKRERQIALPLSIVNTLEMQRTLQAQGFMVRPSNRRDLGDFIVSWIRKLQESKDAISNTAFGWHFAGSKAEGFSYAGKMFTPSGAKATACADGALLRQYTPAGDIQPWKDVMKFITDQDRPDIELIVASAFAGPLVQLTGHKGLQLSVWSQESGIGKSTAMTAAQAVWADPSRAMQGMTDTTVSLFLKMAALRHLPVYWDEIKGEESMKKFMEITFQFTQGRDRTRGTQNIKLRNVDTWRTILVSATNDSVIDYVVNRTSTTTAGLYRVFEYEVQRGLKGQISSSDVTRMQALLDHNYGHAGLIYSDFLGKHHETIDKQVSEYSKRVEKRVGAINDERNWTGMMTTLYLGAYYANYLGLADFNLSRIEDFLYATFDEMRKERNSHPVDMSVAMNVSDKLAQFFHANRQRHFVMTNRIHTSRGKPPKGSITELSTPGRVVDGVFIQVGRDDGLMRISSSALTDWLKQKGYSRHIFMQALEKEFGCKIVHGRMAAGLKDYEGFTEYLLEFNIKGSELLDIITEK